MALLATPSVPRGAQMPEKAHQTGNLDRLSDRYTPSPASRLSEPAVVPTTDEIVANLHRETVALQLAIPEADVSDRLLTAVKDAADRDADSIARLRTAVMRYTALLKERGTTPEQVLIALKTLINNRSLVAIEPHTSDWTGYTLREQMSTWCIEGFFEESAIAPPQTPKASTG